MGGSLEHAQTRETVALPPSKEGRDAARPFRGFERERSTFHRARLGLLAIARTRYVVIVGEDVDGPWETFEEAEKAGYRRFGFGPLYIKQIREDEPTSEVSRDIA